MCVWNLSENVNWDIILSILYIFKGQYVQFMFWNNYANQ